MKKIDLHQDIILSFESNLQGFCDQSLVQNSHGTYAGNHDDYKESDIQIVRAANRPYRMEGDITDVIGRKVTYDKNILLYQHTKMQELAQMYDIGIITKRDDMYNLKNLNILHHVEGIEYVQSIEEIEQLFKLGVRSLGFVWNFDNTLAHTSATAQGGLTSLGKDAVHYMNTIGMVIDTAHMNHDSMMDVVRESTKPILNSHSNLKHFCSHTRNVEDAFLIELAKNGGVLGLSVYSLFLSETGEANLDDYIEQIQYIRNMIGDEHIALGSDYHGLPTKKCALQLQKISQLTLLEERMIKEFGDNFTQKFFYDNSMRVLQANIV